jgi:K+-sensing histidine kinase KdpD
MAFTVPLSIIDSKGKRIPYGILGISSKRTDFSDFDLELIRILSVHSTQVLSNLELIKKLEKEKNLSTTLLDIMTHDISNCIQMCYLVISSIQEDSILPSNEDLDATVSIIESNIRILRNVKRLSVTKTSEADLMPIDLKKSLEQAIKTIRTENPKRKLEIDLDIDDGIYIFVDDLIQDIWLNIFRNTLKFDRLDVCEIGIGWDIKMGGNEVKVLVKITDHGPGIPDKEKELIFGREHRGKTKTKGSGIGLFVVSTLMDYYNGSVWIENRVKRNHKKGSVFCFEFTTPQE